MKDFIGVFRCEYTMSIRRLSLWLAFGLLLLIYLIPAFGPPDLAGAIPAENEILPFVATNAFMLNIFMPVVGGILAADRLVRDQKLGMDELLWSTSLKRGTYLAGKYFATLLSIATPVLLGSLILSAQAVAVGAPLAVLPASVLAFLGINLPAYAFITAFSLVCPLVIPVRVYQVLFTGYWFWGNLLSSKVIPTLNGTYLTPNGLFVSYGFFGGLYQGSGPEHIIISPQIEAVINLAVLGVMIALAMFAADRYLALRARRA